MSDWLTRTQEQMALRWAAILYAVLFTLSSLGTCIVAALYGMRWKECDSQDKFIVIVLITTNWASTMMAYINRSAVKLRKGDLPFEETTIVRRNEVAVSQTETVKPST